jgi:hypothetical protein
MIADGAYEASASRRAQREPLPAVFWAGSGSSPNMSPLGGLGGACVGPGSVPPGNGGNRVERLRAGTPFGRRQPKQIVRLVSPFLRPTIGFGSPSIHRFGGLGELVAPTCTPIWAGATPRSLVAGSPLAGVSSRSARGAAAEVGTDSAVVRVPAEPAAEYVAPSVAVQRVVARSAAQSVVPGATAQRVTPSATAHVVVTGEGTQRVVARASEQRISEPGRVIAAKRVGPRPTVGAEAVPADQLVRSRASLGPTPIRRS